MVEDGVKGSILMQAIFYENIPSVSLTTTVKYFTAPLVSLNQLQLKVKWIVDLVIIASFLFTRIYAAG